MTKIHNYDEAQQLSKAIKSAKAKLRNYRKQLPAKFGKRLLQMTRIPMYKKNGKPVMYRTKRGPKQRYRNVRSWEELRKLYYIAPKSKYNLTEKLNPNNNNRPNNF